MRQAKDAGSETAHDNPPRQELNPKPKGRKFSNPCNVQGHSGHDWYDCSTNPYSKNYTGTVKQEAGMTEQIEALTFETPL